MRPQEQLYSDWRNSTKKIFWGLTLALILTFFANIFDMFSWIPIAIEMALHHSQSEDASLWDSKFFCFGVGVKVIIVISYILYFIGLGEFAKTRQTENASHYVYKARTASVIILITAVVNTFFGLIAIVPIIGQIFMFMIWLLYVIAFFIMKNAYNGMMNCDEFSVVAKQGSKNVRYACVCMLRLLFAPIIIIIIGLLGAVVFGGSFYNMSSSMSFEDMKNMFMGGAVFLAITGVVIVLFLICWAFCAIIWPMMGWNRIKNGGPVDIKHIVEKDKEIDTPEEAIPSIQPKEQEDNSIIQQEETTEKNNRTLTYAISGIIAVALIGIISFFAFGGNKQSDNILGLQKPTWKKFVVVNGNDAYLYRQPDTNSDELKDSGCDGDCDPIYVWNEADLQEGYQIQNNVVSDGLVYPVIEETSDWYKVHISQYNVREAWIKKSACTEVKPEPITTATIKKISYGWENYRFIEEGKYKDMFFRTYEMFAGNDVQMGVLDNGVLLASTAATDVNIYYELEESLRWIDTSNAPNEDFAIYQLAITDKLHKDEVSDGVLLDPSKLSDVDIETLVTTFKPGKKDGVNAYYYFPTVNDKDIIRFTIYPDGSDSTDNNETTASNDQGSVSDYKVEDNVLYAKMGEEWIATDITSEYNEIMIDKKHDLDNNGDMEAIVYESDERELYRPFIVYYDKEESAFKKTENLEFNSMPTTQTTTDGNMQLLQREGIRWIVYSFHEGNLKRIEDRTKDVGRVRTTLRMNDYFANDGTGSQTISIDIDGDGEEESVVIHRDESHAGGYGEYMSICIIRWQDGREIGSENNNVVSGATIKILEKIHNGMPDIIADNYLKRWNGNDYESWGWDGKELKKEY